MDTDQKTSPSSEDLLSMARTAYAQLPGTFVDAAKDVLILVEEFPSLEIQRDLDLKSPFDLLGLYDGVSLLDKSVLDTPLGPDTVTLYRRPILDYQSETGEDLEHLVRHILIHEIGHHFGFSDEDMENIERKG